MPYDRELAERVRELVAAGRGVEEKPMFGGLAFLIGGHLAVAVSGSGGLMVRVPPAETARWLRGTHVEPMVMSGREVRGWVRVQPVGLQTRAQLAAWVRRGVDHATSL